MKIVMDFDQNLRYEAISKTFNNQIDRLEVLRYLKGLYTNKNQLIEKFISNYTINKYTEELFDFFLSNFNYVNTFTYKEAFLIDDKGFQGLVFSSINISEMIENLGATKLKVDGIEVERKIFSKSGEFLGLKKYHNIYETYQVSGKILNLEEDLFAIKVWCTSTNEEHWLWIDKKHRHDPLSAIASTFHIHKNLIPHIKELKRQGDIMLVELNKEIEPSGELIPLTKEQYFKYLTSET
jgi:hypothetical protein